MFLILKAHQTDLYTVAILLFDIQSGHRCSTMASSQLPPPRSFVPSALPLTTVVSSSSTGRVPMAELAYDAIGVSAADASVSISRADEGESALVFDSRRVADYSILPTRPNQPGKPITIKGMSSSVTCSDKRACMRCCDQ